MAAGGGPPQADAGAFRDSLAEHRRGPGRLGKPWGRSLDLGYSPKNKPALICMDKAKEIVRTAVKMLPRKMRYSVRSSLGLYPLHQHPELNLIDFHKGSHIIFDVGAHEGGFTGDLLLRAPLSSVHCFEPNPAVFPTLEEKCKSYGTLENKPRATARNLAVGSTNESKEFLVTKNSACSSFLPRLHSTRTGQENSANLKGR